MTALKKYSFASGGIIWKFIDRAQFEARSNRQRILFVIALILICWLPLLFLNLNELGWASCYSLFIRDIATHVRFLLVLPILLFARRSFNLSFDTTIHFFYKTKIVDHDNREAFEKVLSWLGRWVNSRLVDVFMILVVYGLFYFQENSRINQSSIYAPWHLWGGHLTPAGWWYLFFSLPIFQLILYRWLYTIVLWIIFLRKISKLNLHLSALHPDGMGGLGFLQYAQLSFFPVALAYSSLIAGAMNNVIIFSKASLLDYKIALGSILVFVLLLFVLPLIQFVPILAKTKQKYFMEYSLQAWPFVKQFEKELKEYSQTEEKKPDASGHIDFVGSFEKTKDMQISLVDKSVLLIFGSAVVLPFIPVVAQQIPLKELFINLIGKFVG